MAKPTAADRRAAIKYGPSVRRIARGYRNPYTGKRLSGAALLLKLASGESGFNSSANSGKAQGRTQFTPASRRIAIQKYGVDPLSSIDAAYHAAALHLRGKINGAKGLEGYNPGMASYPSYILGQKVGKIRGAPGGSGAAAGGVSGTPGSPATAGAQNIAMGSTGALAAIAALTQQKPSPPPSALPAPSFAAAPTLPQGYAGVQTGGGPEPKGPDIDALLEQIRTQGGDVQLAPGQSGTAGMPGVTGGIGSSPTGKGGRVVVAPGANRAGAEINPAVLSFARKVSGLAGQPLRIGTGTRHSRLTINGTVSDHWSGNGVDIPKAGRGLVKIGQDALIAAGMDPRKARKIHGGGFNVGGWQIIFNTDAPGWGDHTDHLHIGRRRR